MKIYSLNIFDNFKCIANNCKHSCCEKKWIIDIDKKSLRKYKKIKGDYKNKIDDGVDFDNSTFLMKENKCAFFNDNRLCDLIVNFGEKSLCQICRDHPRFRNYYSDRIETGVGLTCEVIAEKVCTFTDDILLYKKCGVSIRRLNAFERKKISEREKIFNILLDKKTNISKKIDDIFDYVKVDREKYYSLKIKDVFDKLEYLDNTLKNKIDNLGENISKIEMNNRAIENLLIYFVYRHIPNAVDDFDIRSRIVFSILSVNIIENILKSKNLSNNKIISNLQDISREFSTEIEYSDNNLNSLLDITDNLIKII